MVSSEKTNITTFLSGTLWLCFGICLILFVGCSVENITTSSLLEEMADRTRLTYYPDLEFKLKQASSYNRLSVAEGNADWFANNDMSHFIRIDTIAGRREFVMLDAEGPGAIVRWWMTFYKAQNGWIRVYLDHDTVPVIEGKPADVLSGEALVKYPFSASVQKGAPVGEVGRDYDHNFYLPIPYTENCKITYECDSLVMLFDYEGTPVPEGYYWPDVFYNICYRQYLQGSRIESFSSRAMNEAGEAVNRTAGLLLQTSTGEKKLQKEIRATLAPGDSLMIRIDSPFQAVEAIKLTAGAIDLSQALRSTRISMSFDGIQTVSAPAGEFFGSGNNIHPHTTWMNRTDENGNIESYWVMPFRESYALKIKNNDTQEVSLAGELIYGPYNWKPNSMYFASQWHEYDNIGTRDDNGWYFDLDFIDVTGKGVYAGDQITLFNPVYHWWGEGDEKIFVDGELFPSIFGTGTEDYYGYSFGRPEAFSHPFLSQPTGAGNSGSGYTTNMRHRSLDAIPFSESLRVKMELWHWADVEMNYAVITYFYILPPFKINLK